MSTGATTPDVVPIPVQYDRRLYPAVRLATGLDQDLINALELGCNIDTLLLIQIVRLLKKAP